MSRLGSVAGWVVVAVVAEAGGAAAAVGLRVIERAANMPVLGDLLFGRPDVKVDYPATSICRMCGPWCRCG